MNPLSKQSNDPKETLASVDELLTREYGAPLRNPRDPLDELIMTILSQNTNGRNRERAFAAMTKAFPAWNTVMNAPREDLENALRPGGLAKIKSGRIQKILRSLNARGELNLDYLSSMPDDEAEAELLAFDGVGDKTARCVLLFSLEREVFPIDTHIFRVLTRAGVISQGMNVNKAHRFVPEIIPKGRCLSLHLNLIRHGREICHPRRPECLRCVIEMECIFSDKYFAD
ncbi:endonuclease III domain-containing protein [Candidatus Hydrogenedentota bacterium]